MYRLSAVIGGVVGGMIGAGVWAAIAYFASLEVGWIAWGVGLLVGVGVAMGNRGEGSTAAGVMAAVIALLSVAAGKYAAVQLLVPDESELVANSVAALENKELLVSYVADGVVVEFEAEGRPVDWPAGSDPQQAAEQADYPADVWAVAQARWDSMPADSQEVFRMQIAANIEASAAAFRDALAQQGFLGSFGLFDIVFFGLAIYTAFKIAQAGSLKGSAQGLTEAQR
jgi:hypothetical protein